MTSKLFQCSECKLWYETKELAQRCEEFCRTHHACDLRITKFAVKSEKNKG